MWNVGTPFNLDSLRFFILELLMTRSKVGVGTSLSLDLDSFPPFRRRQPAPVISVIDMASHPYDDQLFAFAVVTMTSAVLQATTCPTATCPQDGAAPPKDTEHGEAKLATGDLLPLCNTTPQASHISGDSDQWRCRP